MTDKRVPDDEFMERRADFEEQIRHLRMEVITIHELSNDLASLRTAFVAFKDLMKERHERYDERDTANKERVAAAFNAAEKATEKTEAALKEYKAGANEWGTAVKALASRGAGMKELWGWIAFVVMASIAVVGLFLR